MLTTKVVRATDYFFLADLWQKTLRVNEITMKKFLKNLALGNDFKLWIPPLIYKVNTHNMTVSANIV